VINETCHNFHTKMQGKKAATPFYI